MNENTARTQTRRDVADQANEWGVILAGGDGTRPEIVDEKDRRR